MIFKCYKSNLKGKTPIPASKSHTIRAVAIASLAQGKSVIHSPLASADTLSALHSVEALGARIERQADAWEITGFGPQPQPRCDIIDVGNSGTTLRILMGVAALMPENREITLTGDRQIQTRPAKPLIQALNDLGATAISTGASDCPPYRIRGRLQGGKTSIEAKSSQYLTSLLMACPLAAGDTDIEVPLLYESQYVRMTLWWLAGQNIKLHHDDLKKFVIAGGQTYSPFKRRIPADFSSAAFFFGAGALAHNKVTSLGLDMNDTQGDKAVLDYLRDMGAEISFDKAGITVSGRGLKGIDIDMNETPDALPVMAVLGCFAEGTTVLRNVAQARIKETDRIAVMARELGKMGGHLEELEDGLVIHQSDLHGARVDGHNDHRVVMALTLAGLNCPGTTVVETAEAAGVTFPDFAKLMTQLGGKIETAP